MNRVTIYRKYMPFCTTGTITYKDFTCKTLELAWVFNKTGSSCIPEGIYQCKKINSPHNGECIEVMGVEGRTHIQIHAGNYTSDILGCILVGREHKDINADGVPDVTSSRVTLKNFMDAVPFSFELEIQ